MNYPTLEQVNAASHEQLARWYRHLPSPGATAAGRPDFDKQLREQMPIMDRICERFTDAGGFTPELSKKIGWG